MTDSEFQLARLRLRWRARRLRAAPLFAGLLLFAALGCSDPTGKYSDASGVIVLELKTGGSATLSFAGVATACTWAADGPRVKLDCKGDAGKIALTVHDDGSLWGPPNSEFPLRRVRQ